MADFDYFQAQQGAQRAAQTAQTGSNFGASQWLGAACSLVLIVGLCIWAVQLVLRDVTEVPVIRALATPMRVQPVDPGGQQMAHQGLAVNEIRAGGIATPAPERIVLAPAPVNLAAPAAAETRSASRPTSAPQPLGDANVLADPLAAVDAAAPLERSPAFADDILPAALPGINRSARPRPRPEGVVIARTASALPTVAPVASSNAREVDPGSVPAGTRLVQLGAFDDAASARREWDRLYAQFGDYMEGKGRMVMQARSGGRDFYRLRVVGFEGANDARRFCSAFLARNTACIPVVSR